MKPPGAGVARRVDSGSGDSGKDNCSFLRSSAYEIWAKQPQLNYQSLREFLWCFELNSLNHLNWDEAFRSTSAVHYEVLQLNGAYPMRALQ